MGFQFHLIKTDTEVGARLGKIITAHGEFETPAFIPVGSQATIKSMTSDDLVEVGVEIISNNSYHLYLRPGHRVIEQLGGLHRFMNWNRPILTDSGGYQLFSLGPLREISTDGVTFQSHIDGSRHFISPEMAIEIQRSLGADIIMSFDECIPYPASYEYALRSTTLTTEWARQCKEAHRGNGQALFGIVQGGMFEDLREKSARELCEIGFDGYAIGGLSVGESREVMYRMVNHTAPLLPRERPRYLMGVGKPEDIINAVKGGIDLFDCVIPTRNARNGMLFTSSGKLVIKNARHAIDERPIEEGCDCYTCRHHSRAYLRHLYMARETLALRLNTIHNLHYYVHLFKQVREAILRDRLLNFCQEWQKKRKEKDAL
ncbi:MAG: tRNA guanosine(34) transglycosylase Tgt [Thermodesulfobacteriota bacterium]